jgi:hypothetical protein
MELPLYRIVINDEDETGCTTISLVENPAVEIPFLCFSDEHEKELFHADEDKHIISGIAMLADTPIYRNSPTRGEYQIVFEKETIRKMVQKYAKNQLYNLVNLQHDSNEYVNNCYLIESLIIDKQRGICPNEFQNVPDGSWYISYYVDDEALWNEIKNGKHLNGFSIEILSEIEPVELKSHKNNMNKLFKMAKAILKLAEIATDKETLIIEGEIEVGKPVFIETEEGPVEANDGEYTLEDGTVLVITEGVIAEIKPVEAPEEEKPAEEMEEETPEAPENEPDPRIAELEAEIEALKKEIEEKDAKIAELEGTVAEQEEKLKMSVETPITKKISNKENKALKYFNN